MKNGGGGERQELERVEADDSVEEQEDVFDAQEPNEAVKHSFEGNRQRLHFYHRRYLSAAGRGTARRPSGRECLRTERSSLQKSIRKIPFGFSVRSDRWQKILAYISRKIK